MIYKFCPLSITILTDNHAVDLIITILGHYCVSLSLYSI